MVTKTQGLILSFNLVMIAWKGRIDEKLRIMEHGKAGDTSALGLFSSSDNSRGAGFCL